jgi:hypothetical protein
MAAAAPAATAPAGTGAGAGAAGAAPIAPQPMDLAVTGQDLWTGGIVLGFGSVLAGILVILNQGRLRVVFARTGQGRHIAPRKWWRLLW